MNTLNQTPSAPLKKGPADFVREVFITRRERNSSYTMRAFARDLGVSCSLLSRVLSNTRPMTLKLAMQISSALALSDIETRAVLLSVLQASTKNSKISKKVRAQFEKDSEKNSTDSGVGFYTTLEIEQFKAMANWYHLAILNMTSLDHFKNDPVWIARQLGISTAEVIDAIDRLFSVGLLQEKEDKLQRTSKSLELKTHRSEFAVRKFHEQMILKAKTELLQTSASDFCSRLINGITFSCGEEHLEAIKDKINQFEDEVLKLASFGTQSSVYQLNVQFFPLTKIEVGNSI